jgi:DNA topoisomerase VI subunit B
VIHEPPAAAAAAADGTSVCYTLCAVHTAGATAAAALARYLRQIAVITPYAEFQFFYRAEGDEKANTRLVFRWVMVAGYMCAEDV